MVVRAKLIRLELLQVKGDLERELGKLVLNCTACGQGGPLGSGSQHGGPWPLGAPLPGAAREPAI
jgi:hypothetical protein